MQQHMLDTTVTNSRPVRALLMALTVSGLAWPSFALAQDMTVTPSQKATAAQVAQSGVPLSELAPGAPDSYTVKPGDTLWAISGLFLKSPWRWPELWGMNREEIANPNRIFPGQILRLDKRDGVAKLSAKGLTEVESAVPIETLHVSPRNRSESLNASSLPTLQPQFIEPFLVEPNIVTEDELLKAPRIVAAQEGRVLLSRGDRAYVRGPAGSPVTDPGTGARPTYRVYRNGTALRDPSTRSVLGYEAQYVGKAVLVYSESTEAATGVPIPATIDIVEAKEEMRVGDRMLVEPERQLRNFVPRAPEGPVEGRIVSVYGSSVVNAAQNQVVVISRGLGDGLKAGDVLAILKDGATLVDRTDPAKAAVKIPNERNGLIMVFRTFEKLSYALILEITDGVKVGDRVTNPR